jgi:Pyruvate/2-oxoacid:ferredoxin oxidoreductase gamma subunit
VKPGGMIFANSKADAFPDARVAPYLSDHGITSFAMEAGKTAFDLGAPRSTNLAMVAFFAAFGQGPLDADALRETVRSMSPDPVKEINLKIFDTCLEQGKKLC